MVYNFRTHEISHELTLHATHTYIWSRTQGLARSLCWEIFTEDKHEELLRWTDSLDLDQHLDALRACLVFSVSNGQVVPQKFQLETGLAAYQGKNTIVNAGTGSGKTLSMAIPLLMDPDAVAIIISLLKCSQSTQARELEQFLIKPLAINQDIKVASTYNAMVISPEQSFCDPTSGATPKLLGLSRTNHAFLSSTTTWKSDLDKILQILNVRCAI